MHPWDWFKEKLEEAGEPFEDFKGSFVDEPADVLQGLREHWKHQVAGFDRTWKYLKQSDAYWAGVDFAIDAATYRTPKGAEFSGRELEFPSLFRLVKEHWRDEYKREYEPDPAVIEFAPGSETNLDQVQGQRIETAMLRGANDRRERRQHLIPQDWDLEILPNQRLADLQELGIVSGDVTAQTWLLGDAIQYGLAPALSGAVDSITPADIAFGEMDMGYDDLRWVSDDVLEGLTVNAAAMSGAVTPWAAGMSETLAQRRRELEAYRPQPAPVTRRDSPPGGGSSGGGLSWNEGLDLYQRRSGERAKNIEWMRTRPGDRAESGPNAGSTFREIVQDAVRKSGREPLFAMGGVVPGVFGTPVPAVVHGGERIVGAGNAGGVPMNLEVHVHGTVISEGDLANNVRNGLMRRLS